MARFERAGEYVEVWLERVESPEGEYRYPELMSRNGRIGESHRPEPIALAMRYQFSGDRELRSFQLERLEDGWHRVRDPDREAEVDELIDPALEALLHADPSNAEIAMVYADWLQHRDHPRGALIAVQVARATRDTPELAAEEQALFDQHRETLLGPLDDFVTPDHGETNGLVLEWEHGFIKRARITKNWSFEPEVRLWELVRHPSARFLRELEVGCVLAGDQNNAGLAALLIRGGPTPPLHSLWLADFDDSDLDNIDISRAPIGDLRDLGQRYPQLERVILKGTGDVQLAGLALPNAKKFALRTSTMTKLTLQTILSAAWPELVDLELWFGAIEDGYGANCTLEDVAPLFRMALPKLRALRIMNAMFTDEVVPLILAWPGAAQLTTLDFSLGTLSDAGARELAKGRARLPALERLGVFECSLTPAGLALLAEAGFPVDPSAISPAENWREPQQKSQRYTSVNE